MYNNWCGKANKRKHINHIIYLQCCRISATCFWWARGFYLLLGSPHPKVGHQLGRDGPWLGPPLAKGPHSMLSVWGVSNKGLVVWNDATSSMRHGSFWCGKHTGGGLWASETSVFLAKPTWFGRFQGLKPYVFFEVDIDNFDPYPTDSALITGGSFLL